MPLDPRTPVLVAAAAVQQRPEDPQLAVEPVALMVEALQAAAADIEAPALLATADAVMVPRGFWDYPDPGRWVAEALGAESARTTVAEIGVLQTTLFSHAAAAIAGGASVVLIAGAEAKDRAKRLAASGAEVTLSQQPEGTVADCTLRPADDILAMLEIQRGLAMPVTQYSMIENALRAARGQSLEAHRREIAELWSDMSHVAAENRDAWSRQAFSVDTLLDPQGPNAMLASPYGRMYTSQWNVDQAAGLIFCSAEAAERYGIPRDRWVFPLAVAESNHMVPLSRRASLARCPGFQRAGESVSDATGIDLSLVTHRELYSCFPVAVRLQALEFGMPLVARHSMTGGMAFAGGPLNNFVLQAAVRMVATLRSHPGEPGLLTAVSGVLTKQGVSLWSTEARNRFHYEDVGPRVAGDLREVELRNHASGQGTIASYTVLHDRTGPQTVVALCDLPDQTRTLVATAAAPLLESGQGTEWCGRSVQLDTTAGTLRFAN